MSFKNLLDLRKKDVQVIEKIIFAKKPWYQEFAKTLFIILASSAIIWGISKADIISTSLKNKINHQETFGILGIVDSINDSSLILESEDNSTYTIDITKVARVEDSTYTQLQISDILSGDRITVQGIKDPSSYVAKRIVLMQKLNTSLSVATSTLQATSTDTTSTTTATSTDTGIPTDTTSTSTSIVGSIVDAITSIFTGKTSSSTDTSTTTEISTTTDINTTTDQPASTTPTDTSDQTQSTSTDTAPVTQSDASSTSN